MRRIPLPALIAALVCLVSASAEAGTFFARDMPPGPDPDSRTRSYQVYVPDGLPEGVEPPQVTVLHGCRQTEENMIAETRFTELADAHAFIVVFPYVTNFSELRIENCWGFWFPHHRQEGRGEAGDIRRIVGQVERDFGTDPDRRYITGLSSGAAMAVAVAVAYSEDFAAAGAVAGLPYGEDAAAVGFACGLPTQHHSVSRIVDDIQDEQASPAEQRLVPMMVIHSTNDCTVPIRNGLNIRDSWVRYYGADPEPASISDCTTEGVACRRSRYVDEAGRAVVETVFYDGPTSGRTHYWVGDNLGEFADPDGPSASALFWSFFRNAALEPGLQAELRVLDTRVDGRDITVSGRASAGETPIAFIGVRLDGAAPQPEQEAAGSANWTATFADVPADRAYTPVARLVLESGAETEAFGQEVAVGTPVTLLEETGSWQQHLAAGRIAVQRAPCRAAGMLGTCDTDFTSLFFQHQFAPFPVYASSGSGPWYAVQANVPRNGE